MASGSSDAFIDPERLVLAKVISSPAVARAVFEYTLFVCMLPKVAVELASLATKKAEYKDWWWKFMLGKAYYNIGLHREAEKQVLSALQLVDMISMNQYLAKIYLRLDQPQTAIDVLEKASERHPGDPNLLLGIARIHDALGDLSVDFHSC